MIGAEYKLFGNFDLTIDEAAILLTCDQCDEGNLKLHDHCNGKFIDIFSSEFQQLSKHTDDYRVSLTNALESKELGYTRLRKDLNNNSIITNETRVDFAELTEWARIRGAGYSDSWMRQLNENSNFYNIIENEIKLRGYLKSDKHITAILSKLGIHERNITLSEITNLDHQKLYELIRYLIELISQLKGDNSISISEDYFNNTASSRGIGYLAIVLAKSANGLIYGEKLNASAVTKNVTDFYELIIKHPKHKGEPIPSHGLKALNKKISDSIKLVESESGLSIEELLQL